MIREVKRDVFFEDAKLEAAKLRSSVATDDARGGEETRFLVELMPRCFYLFVYLFIYSAVPRCRALEMVEEELSGANTWHQDKSWTANHETRGGRVNARAQKGTAQLMLNGSG